MHTLEATAVILGQAEKMLVIYIVHEFDFKHFVLVCLQLPQPKDSIVSAYCGPKRPMYFKQIKYYILAVLLFYFIMVI